MNIEISDKITFKFEYSQTLVSIFQKIPAGRKYDKATCAWTVEKNHQNLSYLVKAGIGVDELMPLLKEIEKPLQKSDSNDYRLPQIWGKTTPYNHQIEGLSILEQNQSAALFWEQGCGKTLPVIKYLERAGTPALIVCPRNVMQTWFEQFERFSSVKPVIIRGTAKKRSDILSRCVRESAIAEIVIINYDILTSMLKQLQALYFPVLVFDESHYVKNGQAARSRAAHELSKKAVKKILLSGTPIGNGSMDIFHQFLCLDSAVLGSSFFAFRARYFRDKGFDFIKDGKVQRAYDWRIRPEMIDELRQKIATRAQRVRKADCLDLPPKIFQRAYIDLTPEQMKVYGEIENELVVMIGDKEISVRQIITKMGKLNQVCNGFLYSDDDEIMLNDNKVDELIDIWEIAGRPKMVVWTVYQVDVEKIVKAFNRLKVPVVQITGRNSQAENDFARNNFQESESTRVIVCNQQAGGVGITLTASSFVVNYSHNFSYIGRVQAEDRTHRIGQKYSVTYVDMICEGTVEQDIIDALEAKRMEAEKVLGDINPDNEAPEPDYDKDFQEAILNKFKIKKEIK